MVAVTLTATYTTGGLYLWTAPPGVTSVTAVAQGSGGGGGAASALAGANGGGGGGGEAALEPVVPVTPGTGYLVNVGAGGAGGTAATASGDGANSGFSGDGGIGPVAHGGTRGTAGTTGAGQNGTGGTGSTNTVAARGGDGDNGTVSSNGGGGGSAGGASLTAGFPGNGATDAVAGAAAAGATWPGGAGGAGAVTQAAGSAGSGPGGGGGGALSTGTAESGGAGADGQVVITWVQNDPVTLVNAYPGAAVTFTGPLGVSAVKAEAWGGGAGGFNTAVTAGASFVGCSAGLYGATSFIQAAGNFDAIVGRPMAVKSTKIYNQSKNPKPTGQFNFPPSGNEQGLLNAGCQFVLGFGPAVDGSDATALTNCLTSYKAAAIAAGAPIPKVCFYPEGNSGKQITAAQMKTVFQTYYSVPNGLGLTVVYNAAGYTGSTSILAAKPSPSFYDEMTIDYYCSGAYGHNGGNPNPGVDDLKITMAAADADGKPFGLGEFGNSSLTGINPSAALFASYMGDLQSLFTGRLTAGKANSDLMWWANGAQNASPVTPSLVTAFYDALAPATTTTPLGGAGGGGGEYAAEASLGITSVAGATRYALVVGGGGPDMTSGGNSTAAGSSVTVTGHGGVAAVSQSAGGAGGTGSVNTTHHPGGAGGNAGAVNGAGAGGGGSGGTAATGNAGHAPASGIAGAGGAAVTGGGPGGNGGGVNHVGSSPVSGPGGGGGGSGAGSTTDGPGSDGQITLSSFVIASPTAAGNLGIGPLGFAGSAQITSAAGFGLIPLAFAGTGTAGGFSRAQNGTINTTGTGSLNLSLPNPSAAGTLLVAEIAIASLTAATGPVGTAWTKIASQPVGNSGAAHSELWFYDGTGDGKTGTNPGGVTIATFIAGINPMRGCMQEYRPPAGTVASLRATAVNSGGPAVTSFPVTLAAGTAAGDLATIIWQNFFSSTSSSAWTDPAGYTGNQRQATSIVNMWDSVEAPNLAAGTQTPTASAANSTNEVGWGACAAVWTPVIQVTTSAAFTLAPLGFAGTGTSGVPAGTVVSNGGLAIGPAGFQSPSQAVTYPQDALPLMAEILVNGTWTDITSYVYQRDGITISGRGRADEASTAQPAQCTLTLNNADGSFSPQNPAGQFYPYLTRNTQLRISVVNAVTTLGAWYSGYRFWGEVPGWPPLWNPAGTDVYVPVTAAGVLQRMAQSRYQASPLGRYYNQQVTSSSPLAPAGYWPCEDATAAGSFFSGIPGGSPMTFTGTPGLAADTTVPGSAPFAQLNSSVWTGAPGTFTSGGVTFATPGTYTWICPAGVTAIQAECWGGGGGGGNGVHPGGGGGGEYAAEGGLPVTPGNAYTLTVGGGGSGGAGDYNPQRGTPGAASTFTGDTKTVTANGGRMPAVSGVPGGPGGTGSTNTAHHDGGPGGDTRSAGFGGSGGGSSGSTGSAGNPGGQASSDNGASGGAAVVPGGGKGGGGGHGGQVHTPGTSPVPGPGGGGGGGGMNNLNRFGLKGGNGAAGQVALTFGTSTIPPANVLRFVLDVPAGGGTDGATMAQMVSTGTITDVRVTYHTGGNLQLTGRNAGGIVFDSGSHSFGANGHPLLVSAELTQQSMAVKWKLTAAAPGAAAVTATFSGTVTGHLLGPVTTVNVNNAAGTPDTQATGIGHVSVQYAVDPILNLSQALAAYNGEYAATRFARLCAEQRIPVTVTAAPGDTALLGFGTPQMGPQPSGNLVALLQDCENADLGLMFERRDAFGLGYRTRASMQNQSPAATFDYSLQQLTPPLAPTGDDQLTRNDIVATRGNGTTTGTTYEAILQTGTMGTADPPNGAGLYTYTVTSNLFTDSQLAQFATWLLTLGTVDQFRYPVITINQVRIALSGGPFYAAANMDIGDQIQIINGPAWLPPGPVNQLCYGFTETLNAMATWTIAVNAVPADPWTGNGLPSW